jgi:hypothetical protein
MNKLLSHGGQGLSDDASPVCLATFFETLRAEQEQLLKSLRQASSLLDSDAGQLAAFAAVQLRLTQRFFDAQRGLLRRRATVDAEITRLRYTAEADAHALLAAAHQEAASSTVRRALAASHSGPGQHPVLAEWDDARVGAASFDIEALARSIEADVRGCDETATLAQRQLGDLLDEWWVTEQREGRDRLDDATARAAMLQHLVLQEVEAIVSSAATDDTMPESAAPAGATVLPAEFVDAFDTAGDGGLHGLLGELTSWLDGQDNAVDAPHSPPTAAVIRFDEPVTPLVAPAAAVRLDDPVAPRLAPIAVREPMPVAPAVAATSTDDDAFFWGAPATGAVEVVDDPSDPTLVSLLLRAVVPVGVFTALLGLIMAWIG